MRKLAKTIDLSDIKDKRFIIMGDLHGCFDQLTELLKKCNYNKENDIIIATGDLVDRGPNSVDVLRFFMPDNPHEFHHIYSVLGNHDYKFLRYLKGNKVTIGKALQGTIDDFTNKCVTDLEKGAMILYLQALPHIIRLPDFNNKPCYVVHAGVDAKYPVDKQTPETCIFIRGINPKNYFDESEGIWYDFLDGSYYILSGHIGSKSVNPVPWNFALDASCCHGGQLRAMVIENNEYEIVEIEGYKMDEKIPDWCKIINGNNGEKLILDDTD